MIVRAKTKRRLIILLACVVGIAGCVSALVLLRAHQTRRQLELARVDGLAAFERQDYQAVVDRLDQYVNRAKKPDARAILALAQAYRLRSASPTAADLDCAMKGLSMYLDKNPAETSVRRDLVDVLYRLNRHPEAMEQATRVLADPKFKDDYEMLRAKARILAGTQQRPADALEFAERCNALRPLDVEMQEMTLRLYADPRVNRLPKILAKVCDLLDRNPDEPAALALAALGLDALGDDLTAAQQQQAAALIYDVTHRGEAVPLEGLQYNRRIAVETLARKAAAMNISDPLVVLVLRHLFEDRLADVNASVALMEKSLAVQQKPEHDKAIRRALVARLWEGGRYQDVLANVEKLSPTGADPADVDMLVYKATALAALNQKQQAQGVATQLAANEQSKYAANWSVILREGVLAEKPQWARVIAAARQLIDMENDVRWRCPLARYYLGDAYASTGELRLAEVAMEQAIQANRLWGQPYVRMSQVCMAGGDVRSAVLFAELARKLPPQDATLAYAASIKSQVQSARLKAGKDDPYKDLPADDPFRKALDTTLSDLEQVVRKSPADDNAAPAYVLLLAQQGQPDKAQAALKRAIATTRPAVATLDALSRISRDYKLGLEAECETMIAQQGGLTPQAALVRALGQYQKDKSRAQADQLFADARKNSRNGDELAWRFCEAQYLGIVGDAKAGQTWTTLADDPAAKNDLEIQRAALAAAAVQSDIALLNRTIDRIAQLTGDHAITWRLTRAQLLLREKNPDYAKAAKLLEETLALVPGHTDAQLLLGMIAERQGDQRLAIERLTKLADGSPNAPAIRLELARLHMSLNESQLAIQQLERITRDRLTALQVLQVADLYALSGNPAKALELSKSVLALQPDNKEAHKAVVINHLRLGQINEAIKAVEKAPQGENDALARLRKCIGSVAAIADWPGTADLAVALVDLPEQADGAEKALAIVADAKASKATAVETIGKLRALSDTAPRCVTLHVILGAQYRALGQYKEAAQMAIRAREQIPNSSRLAEAAAVALAEAGEWAQVRQAARSWRKMSGVDPVRADFLAALADIRTDNKAEALRLMGEHQQALVKSADQYAPLLATYAQCLLREDRIDETVRLLRPAAAESARWRALCIDLAPQIAKPESAEKWLGEIGKLLPQSAIEEQVRLADAWRALGYRGGRAQYQEKALAILDRLVGENPTRAMLVAQRGLAYEAAGKLKEAESDYRNALAMDDKITPALNNLALLLAARTQPGGDFKESLALAGRAVELTAKAIEQSPQNAGLKEPLANLHDTLATIQAKAGDPKAAITSLKSAVQLQQANPGWKMRLAEVCIQAGDFAQAESALDGISPDRLNTSDKARYEQLRAKVKAPATSAAR